MAILAGIFVLFVAGVIVGQSLLYVRSQEPPNKEPAVQVVTPPSQGPEKTAEPSQEKEKEPKEK